MWFNVYVYTFVPTQMNDIWHLPYRSTLRIWKQVQLHAQLPQLRNHPALPAQAKEHWGKLDRGPAFFFDSLRDIYKIKVINCIVVEHQDHKIFEIFTQTYMS